MKKIGLFFLLLLLSGCTHEINEYVVSFETNGGSSISSVNIEDGDSINEPISPVKDLYFFMGWYSDIDLETEYIFSSQVNNDLILYAKWGITSYTVTFKDYDNTVLFTDDFDSGSDLSGVIVSSPQREGYTFSDWNMALPSTMPMSDVVLTAEYTINTYSLIYKDYDETVIYTEDFEYNTDLSSFTVVDPTRYEHVFAGWSIILPETMPSSDVELTAQWDVNQYTITYVDLEGTYLGEELVNYNQVLDEGTMLKPEVIGRTFNRYSTRPNNMPNEDIEVTVFYSYNMYNLTVWNMDNTMVYINNYYYDGDLTSIVLENPSIVGYIFTGWTTTIPNTMPANDIVIMAEFDYVLYQLTLDKGYETEVIDVPYKQNLAL